MKMSDRQHRRRVGILILVGILLVIFFAWVLWGNTALMVSEIGVTGTKLPQNFVGYRIAQVSDLHNAEFGENNEVLIDLLQGTEPDLIVLTGDLVDSNHTDLAVSLAFAQQAVSIAPTYYVPGNHEARIPSYDQLREDLIRAGVVVLENEAVLLERDGASIHLIGVQDPSFFADPDHEESAMAAILTDLVPEDGSYTVLLSHRPELFDTYVASGVDLVLAGHAHGGQVRLPFLGGVVAPGQGLFPAYDAGLYTEGDTNMVVSRGIGNSIIPFRVNNRPELVLVTLMPPDDSGAGV